MDKRQKAVIRAIEKAVDPLGWSVVSYTRSKHLKIVVKNRRTGQTRKIICSVSASDHRALANVISTAKRICRSCNDA